MKRTTPVRKPDLILCSDMHLREDIPVCWNDYFQTEQWLCVTTITKLQKQHQCPVFHTGDLFHHWKPSPWLLAQAYDLLPAEFYSIYGQHDLPQHNWELRGKSGLNMLRITGRVRCLKGVHYGQEPEGTGLDSIYVNPDDTYKVFHNERKILAWHKLAYQVEPFPGAPPEGNALSILKKYPAFDLIVTGDNHLGFVQEYQGRLLVNPGSMTRQKADQIEYKPRVYLWYAETNTVVPVYLPVGEGMTREHIDSKKQKEDRINAFISFLDTDFKTEVTFEDNLKEFFATNTIEPEIEHLVYKATEYERK